jgi:hypothetical protein
VLLEQRVSKFEDHVVGLTNELEAGRKR